MSMNRIMMLIGGAALIGVVGFAVWFFLLQPAVPSTPGVTTKAETLDVSVFKDQSFSRLRAAQVPNPPVQRGRGNPFSPPTRTSPVVTSLDPGTQTLEPLVETVPESVPPVDPAVSDVGEPPEVQ